MQGFITERDFDLMERVFPGIIRFYLETRPRPVTFLELLWRFQDSRKPNGSPVATGEDTRRLKLL